VTAEERERFFAEARAFTPILAAEAGGATFLVRTTDEVVGRSLFVKGSRGDMGLVSRTLEILRALGQAERVEGRAFLDIGANIGTSSIAALRTGAFSGVVAFEPEPDNYRLLCVNLALNGFEHQARALPVAVSRTSGPAMLTLHTRNSGGHQVATGAGPAGLGDDAPHGEQIPVEAVSLDALVERGMLDAEAVGLVWLDVQGHEGHVLRGARSLTSAGTPVVLEFYPLMLSRSRGMPLLREVAAKRYTHFLDLRDVASPAAAGALLKPVVELSAYAARYSKHAEHHFTDLLLLRI
jgi:FkbM family methyltransferase